MKRALFCAFVLMLTVATGFSDTRTEPIDVYFLVDTSLSMKEKIREVTSFLNERIVDSVLIPGDSLTIIRFYGSAEKVFDRTIASQADITAAHAALEKLRANGHYTDIGNALDVLAQGLAERKDSGHQKYILLLTDGIQEAPPNSRYPIKEAVLKHHFLTYSRNLSHGGWDEITIGIQVGEQTETAAQGMVQTIMTPPPRSPEAVQEARQRAPAASENAASGGSAGDTAAGGKQGGARFPLPFWAYEAGAAIIVVLAVAGIILVVLKRRKGGNGRDDAARQ